MAKLQTWLFALDEKAYKALANVYLRASAVYRLKKKHVQEKARVYTHEFNDRVTLKGNKNS